MGAGYATIPSKTLADGTQDSDSNSQRAVTAALVCNALIFSLKVGVYFMTHSSVMLAEAVHSLADVANQGLLAYGLSSSKRAPDINHPASSTPRSAPRASFWVALGAVRAGAEAEGMRFYDYLWRGHDPTAVAVLLEDGAAVTGLGIAAASMTAVQLTGCHVYDAVGSIAVGGLLAAVSPRPMQNLESGINVLYLNKTTTCKQTVVDAVWDCKSEVIGPGAYRFKAEIDFNGEVIVQHHLNRFGRSRIFDKVRAAVTSGNDADLDRVLSSYGEDLMTALGGEVDRLETKIKTLLPQIRHVDIEAHNPLGPVPRENVYVGSPEK
eukprot:jgi/Mesen1/9620/ME000659S08985